MLVSLRCVKEDKPGHLWLEGFERTWPHYKSWFLKEGATARPGYLTCSTELQNHMPEIYPLYEELCELVGGGDMVSRYLSLYTPPAFMSGCTQVAWTNGDAALIRNYDYDPKLFEGIMLYSNWLKPVIGISDCNWGLLDGMNADGLAVSLTFGGRRAIGKGFGIPLIIRYILETCSSTKEAVDVLKRIPVHMAYNVTVIDKSGDHKSIYLGPDREAKLSNAFICTNHQEQIDWPEYAAVSATVERETFLQEALKQEHLSLELLISKFLQAPLYDLRSERSFATLYTSVYYPLDLKIRVFWPGQEIGQSFDNFEESRTVVILKRTVSGKLTL